MIRINGGTKIMPLHGNVNNTTLKVSPPPPSWGLPSGTAWSGVVWSVGALRDLIRPFCEKKKLYPERVVKGGDPCTPGVALRRIAVEEYELKLADKQKTAV
jgi:hypothetical protein